MGGGGVVGREFGQLSLLILTFLIRNHPCKILSPFSCRWEKGSGSSEQPAHRQAASDSGSPGLPSAQADVLFCLFIKSHGPIFQLCYLQGSPLRAFRNKKITFGGRAEWINFNLSSAYSVRYEIVQVFHHELVKNLNVFIVFDLQLMKESCEFSSTYDWIQERVFKIMASFITL